jgi:hypothetical protein
MTALNQKQLETNLEELRGMPPPPKKPDPDRNHDLIWGVHDRLVAHDRAIVNVVLAPAHEDGSPDWGHADPANLESLPGDVWPDDPQAEKRAGILVDNIDGCSPETAMLIFFSDVGQPHMDQIAGPEADGDIAMRIIGRDIGARPPERAATPLHESMAKLAADLFPPVPANDNVPQAKPKYRFTVDWFCDIEDDIPKEEILKGVLGVDEYTMVSGKPGSGKSVITTDIACHVAAGMDWHGRAVKQGLVVYIAAERKALTKRRMRAFKKHHGIDDIPLAVLGGTMDFTSGLTDANAIIAVVKALEESCGHKCAWIIIDTLTRTFGPGDQNTSKDMVKFVRSCDAIREAVTGTHLTVIHHTGWAGDRGKGAIDLDGAVDASFLVKKEGGAYVLECDGTNDGDEGVITHFRMEGVQVGEKDGEPTMAPVVIPADGKSAGEHLVASMSKHNAKAFDVLADLCGETGAHVSEEAWRAGFYAAYPADKKSALKVRFQRVRKHLTEAGTIFYNNGMYWVSDGT